mgnify:CR=1 FL=1
MTEEKLKTLKDLEIEVIDQINGEPIKHKMLIESEQLKQEAVKWIKELKKYENGTESWGTGLCLICGFLNRSFEKYLNGTSARCEHDDSNKIYVDSDDGDFEQTITFLKHFFNIIEEDLK